MNYSEAILKAHKAWRKAEDKVPDTEHEQSYEKRDKAATRQYRAFEKACKAENLSAVTVAHDLMDTSAFTLRVVK